MLKMKVLGNYAPNLRGLPGSSYLIKGMKQPLLLDFGNGNIKKLLKEIPLEEISNLIVILSHNHIDHSYDVLKLARLLKKQKKKIKIYLPKKSFMFFVISKLKRVFDVEVIHEKKVIFLDHYEIDFCQTFHRGESYAIRIKDTNTQKVFVYTSDMSYISRGLKYFCKDADTVLIDSGLPLEDKFHLKGYHGFTKEIILDLFSPYCNVKRILASHLKAYLPEEYYLASFFGNQNVELVKTGKEYIISQ